MVWWILTAVAAIGLLTHWRGPNAVWGTATLGALVGVVIAAIQPGFDLATIGKALVIGALIGIAFERLPQIARRLAK